MFKAAPYVQGPWKWGLDISIFFLISQMIPLCRQGFNIFNKHGGGVEIVNYLQRDNQEKNLGDIKAGMILWYENVIVFQPPQMKGIRSYAFIPCLFPKW